MFQSDSELNSSEFSLIYPCDLTRLKVSFVTLKCSFTALFCVCTSQHSRFVRRTWRLWRPSATWQPLSGSCHQISPMLGSRIREQSHTSPWWSRRSHHNGSAAMDLVGLDGKPEKQKTQNIKVVLRCDMFIVLCIHHQFEREDGRV